MQSTRLKKTNAQSCLFESGENKKNALLQKRKNKFLKEQCSRVSPDSHALYKAQTSLGLFKIKATDNELDIANKLKRAARAIQLERLQLKDNMRLLEFNENQIKRQLHRLGSLAKLKNNFFDAMNKLGESIEDMDFCLAKTELQDIYNDKSLTTAEIVDKLSHYIDCRLDSIDSQMDVNASIGIRNFIAIFLSVTLLCKQLGKQGILLGLALLSTIAMPEVDSREQASLNQIFDVIEEIKSISYALQLHEEKKPALKKKLGDIEHKIDELCKRMDMANQKMQDINKRLAILENENQNKRAIFLDNFYT